MKKQDEKQNNGFGIASLILGILAVIFAIFPNTILGLICMVLAFIFSGVQLCENRNGIASAGLILASAALGIFIIDFIITAISY